MAEMRKKQQQVAAKIPVEKRMRKKAGYWPRVVVKFRDTVELPYEDGAEKYIEKYEVGPWIRLATEYPGITLRRLFTETKAEQILSLVKKAVENDRSYDPPNLLSYFIVDCPVDVRPEVLVKEFMSWQNVQTAYFDPPGSDPVVAPDDDPRFANQGYLDPAPDGIDAEFAWPRAGGIGFTGGDGEGIRFIDMERGWTLNHEDLNAHGATLLHGTLLNTSRAHGTKVLGEVCAVDNTIGCVGIAPHIDSVNVVSYNGSTRADAIMAAITSISFGDVLLLEAQLDPAGGNDMYPIEVLDAEFDAIRLATALGIIVVEAGGNGNYATGIGNDLDTYTNATGHHILNRTSAEFRDSGAIMVGAASSAAPHTRMTWSNHGSRIDCYGWGENVDTCASDAGGSTTMYTSTFNGTSSASPIITGAAIIVQGISEANLGYRFSPHQLREILSDPANGTASSNPATDRIGVMPDLHAILQNSVLNIAPDVYIRDYVGDTGDTHTGAISASPDIIILPDPVADPQASFGEGSGTENSNILGYEAESVHDNVVYVRVRNRGGTDAANVTATVFWSPAATLVTPDLWTLVGSVVIPNVPAGEVLTVSDPIPWPAGSVPATGHYCFIGIIGNEQDPAPDTADFINWSNYERFIRENNNVTWRNFNVVNNEADPENDPSGYVPLPFLAVGAPDKARRMRLDVQARLPKGSKILLEVPTQMVEMVRQHQFRVKIDSKRKVADIQVNPHGKFTLGELPFPVKFRAKMRLLVRIPKEMLKNPYEVSVRQYFGDQEMGRVTWRLVPSKKRRKD
jgi:hypothetical protein